MSAARVTASFKRDIVDRCSKFALPGSMGQLPLVGTDPREEIADDPEASRSQSRTHLGA